MRQQIVVLEQIDPEMAVASGIDTIIRDFIKYGSDTFEFVVVGVSATRPLGDWCWVEIAGRRTRFLPLARVNKGGAEPLWRRHVPHSLRLSWGLVRHRRKIRTLGADAIHAHRLELGIVARWLLRLPVVQFVHNARASLTGGTSDSAWSKVASVYAAVERSSVRGAAAVGVFSRSETERIRQLRPDVVRCLTWYDPELFRYDDARPPGFAIAWVGRLESQKDPHLALEVFAALLRQRPEATLYLAGGGSLEHDLRDRLRELPPGRVVLLGSQSRRQISELMQRCTGFLMTSHYEGSPTVLVEAAACGLPAVVTHGSDPDFVIQEGTTGMRVERDPYALADALIESHSFRREVCAESVEHRSSPGLPLRLLAELHRTI